MGAHLRGAVVEIQEFENVPVGREHQQGFAFRKQELAHLMKLEMLTGYYLQFGVHRGNTLNFMALERPDVHWYGFDSQDGLPHEWVLGKKIVAADKFKLGDPPVLEPNCTYIKGWFKDTVPPFAKGMKRPAAFIDIDSDVYESAHDVLFGMNEHIVPGTVIRFDELCEWREFNWVKRDSRSYMYEHWREHEWKALQEWLKECGREVQAIYRTDGLAGTIRVLK